MFPKVNSISKTILQNIVFKFFNSSVRNINFPLKAAKLELEQNLSSRHLHCVWHKTLVLGVFSKSLAFTIKYITYRDLWLVYCSSYIWSTQVFWHIFSWLHNFSCRKYNLDGERLNPLLTSNYLHFFGSRGECNNYFWFVQKYSFGKNYSA